MFNCLLISLSIYLVKAAKQRPNHRHFCDLKGMSPMSTSNYKSTCAESFGVAPTSATTHLFLAAVVLSEQLS